MNKNTNMVTETIQSGNSTRDVTAPMFATGVMVGAMLAIVFYGFYTYMVRNEETRQAKMNYAFACKNMNGIPMQGAYELYCIAETIRLYPKPNKDAE